MNLPKGQQANRRGRGAGLSPRPSLTSDVVADYSAGGGFRNDRKSAWK